MIRCVLNRIVGVRLLESDKQLALAEKEVVELKLILIDKEAFVFFVNSKNKVNDLSIEANYDNIRSGKYPFAKEFYAVTRNNETRETRELIEWIRSEQGKELIWKSGFVPVE